MLLLRWKNRIERFSMYWCDHARQSGRSTNWRVVSLVQIPLKNSCVRSEPVAHAMLNVHPLVRPIRQGIHVELFQARSGGERIIAELRASPETVVHKLLSTVQRTRVAEFITDIFSRGLCASETKEHLTEPVPGDLRRTAPQERPEDCGGARRNGTEDTSDAGRRVPAGRGERWKDQRGSALASSRAIAVFHGRMRPPLSSWTLLHAGPQFDALPCTSVCFVRVRVVRIQGVAAFADFFRAMLEMDSIRSSTLPAVRF